MRKGLLLGLVTGIVLMAAVGIISLAGADPVAPAQASSLGGDSEQSAIWVSGSGEVTVVPDLAIVSLGVEAEAATVEGAMDEAAEAMDSVVAALRANGVAEKDIQTRWFNIYPVRRWTDNGQETLLGYTVTNMVTVKIGDVEATGGIIDEVADAGGDLIRIEGVSFTVDDSSQYYGEARAEAVADATAKAQQLANLAGVQLGAPFYISEGGGYTPIYRDYGFMAAEGDGVPTTSISPGETEVVLTVQMAFTIQ
jgi:uncharacterized protein YggE